jgi:transposase
MEASAFAHHWGRELRALGHEVRLMPPAYVKPYVKSGKTDAADAKAFCEAVTRPTMRLVAVKSEEQQAILMLHKTRDLLVWQRTGLINALRSRLVEYGIVASQGPGGVKVLVSLLHEKDDILPSQARVALRTIVTQLRAIATEIERLEAEVLAWHRTNESSRRLTTIPGSVRWRPRSRRLFLMHRCSAQTGSSRHGSV